jgi:hypothetical protein
MKRLLFLPLSFLLVSPSAFAQSSPTDSEALQGLLAEVRQLRQVLQSSIVTSQRAQILFYRVQMQEMAVARTSQRLDDARSKLAETQSNRNHFATEAKQAEDDGSRIQNAAERKNFEDMARYWKKKFEALADEEQQRQAKEIEAKEDMRLEQVKLSELQERLDELDKALGKVQSKSP